MNLKFTLYNLFHLLYNHEDENFKNNSCDVNHYQMLQSLLLYYFFPRGVCGTNPAVP